MIETYKDVHEFLKAKLLELKKGKRVESTNKDNKGTLKEELVELPHQFFCIEDSPSTVFHLPSFRTQPWWMTGELITEFLAENPPTMNRYRPDLIEASYKLTPQGVCSYLYGVRWSNWNQIETARQRLIQNPNSKKVIIQTWEPQDMMLEKVDSPCNVNYMLLGRNGKLDLTATIRSNDIMRGVKYDYYLASFMQQSLASMTGMECGKLYFSINSLHTYTKDESQLEKVLEELQDAQPPIRLELPPGIDVHDYWNNLRHIKKAEDASYNGAFSYFDKHLDDMGIPLFRDFARIYGIKNAKTNNRQDLVDKYKSELEVDEVRRWLNMKNGN